MRNEKPRKNAGLFDCEIYLTMLPVSGFFWAKT